MSDWEVEYLFYKLEEYLITYRIQEYTVLLKGNRVVDHIFQKFVVVSLFRPRTASSSFFSMFLRLKQLGNNDLRVPIS